MRICQLQNILSSIFIISFLSGCGTHEVTPANLAKKNDQVITPGWYKLPLRFTHMDKDDSYLLNPFFDLNPKMSEDRRWVNYFTIVPEQSSYKYNFDLYSGKLYKDRDYCPVDDVWNGYSGDVMKPNFTQGIVPRIYSDKNMTPQKIMIFSDPQFLGTFKLSPTNYEIGKIVGSVILESCESFPCDSKAKWNPTQILIAINPDDPKFSAVENLSEVKKIVDWSYVKAILVNQDGVHRVGNKSNPAFRVSKELGFEESMNYFEKHSTTANLKELNTFREGCFKLYDDIWSSEEKIRKEKSDQQRHFLSFFKDFYKKNSDQFYKCQQLVRPANINENDKRLWFFTYLQAFTNLEKNGFYYSCADKSWFYNPKIDGERYMNDPIKELEKCRARDFEKSFDQAINGISLMRNQINRSYRFIEYDTAHGGSHQKIYGWILEGNKTSVCKYEKNKENQFDVFPQDVVWQSFTPDDSSQIK